MDNPLHTEQTMFCAYTGADTGTSICARNLTTGVIDMTYRGDACRQVVMVEGCYLVGVDEVRPKIIVWVLNKKDPVHTIACPSRPRCISASECYVAAGIENSIYLWMICTGSLMRKVDHHLQAVTSLQFESNLLFVSGDEEGCVAVWSVLGLLQRPLDHDPVCRSDHHSGRITHVSISRLSSDDFIVASASLDRSVRVWRGRQMLQTHLLQHHTSATCILIHTDLLIVAFEDGSLRFSSLFDSTIPPTTIPYKSAITSMAMVGVGGQLVVGMGNGEVAVSMIKQPPHNIYKHPGRITCLLVQSGLEEGWNKPSWKAPIPFLSLSTQADTGGREMVMCLRGHHRKREGGAEDDDDRVVRRVVVEVARKQTKVIPLKKRKQIVQLFIKHLYNKNNNNNGQE